MSTDLVVAVDDELVEFLLAPTHLHAQDALLLGRQRLFHVPLHAPQQEWLDLMVQLLQLKSHNNNQRKKRKKKKRTNQHHLRRWNSVWRAWKTGPKSRHQIFERNAPHKGQRTMPGFCSRAPNFSRKYSQLLNSCGIMKCSSAHNSSMEFCSGVPLCQGRKEKKVIKPMMRGLFAAARGHDATI